VLFKFGNTANLNSFCTHHEEILESWGMSPCILILATKWRLMIVSRSFRFTSWEKRSLYPFNRRLYALESFWMLEE